MFINCTFLIINCTIYKYLVQNIVFSIGVDRQWTIQKNGSINCNCKLIYNVYLAWNIVFSIDVDGQWTIQKSESKIQ